MIQTPTDTIQTPSRHPPDIGVLRIRVSEVLSGGPDSFGGADTSVADVTRIVIEDEPVLLNQATSEMNNLETITD